MIFCFISDETLKVTVKMITEAVKEKGMRRSLYQMRARLKYSEIYIYSFKSLQRPALIELEQNIEVVYSLLNFSCDQSIQKKSGSSHKTFYSPR